MRHKGLLSYVLASSSLIQIIWCLNLLRKQNAQGLSGVSMHIARSQDRIERRAQKGEPRKDEAP